MIKRKGLLLVQEQYLIHALTFVLRGVDVNFVYALRNGIFSYMVANLCTGTAVDNGIGRTDNADFGSMHRQGQLRVQRALTTIVEGGEIRIHQGVRV